MTARAETESVLPTAWESRLPVCNATRRGSLSHAGQIAEILTSSHHFEHITNKHVGTLECGNFVMLHGILAD